MMVYNNNKAARNAGVVAIFTLMLIGTITTVSANMTTLPTLFYILSITIGLVVSLCTYFISFIIYEKRG